MEAMEEKKRRDISVLPSCTGKIQGPDAPWTGSLGGCYDPVRSALPLHLAARDLIAVAPDWTRAAAAAATCDGFIGRLP